MDWSSLQVNSAGQITIPSSFGGQSIDVIFRTDKGAELTYPEGDANLLAVQIRNFTVLPFSGTEDTITRILGGFPGMQVLLRPAQSGNEITLQNSANLFIPSGTITLADPSHVVMFVCLGTAGNYAKLLL